MDDEWCRCPICFEDYSSIHRPTTFSCGHSICIDHVTGFQQIRSCPICRLTLRPGNEYHVSYNLEDAARFYQLIKDKIDWSTINFSSTANVQVAQDSTAELIHRDEIYARRLQAELNRESRSAQQPQPRAANLNRENRTAQQPQQTVENVNINRPQQINRPTGTMKSCGHGCDLVSTNQCCTCLDQRPMAPNGRYETYVDGVGNVNQAQRNAFYCSTCKRR